MFKRILVPLDGSPMAEAILSRLGRLIGSEEAEVLLVRAVPPPMSEGAVLVLNQIMDGAEHCLKGVQARLQKEGRRARGVVRLGTPGRVILDVAEEEQVSLIAMTTHGRTGLSRWVFGSVAEKVIHEARVPVLIFKGHAPARVLLPVANG